MKISKLKSILFILIAISSISVFMISCEKEDIQLTESDMYNKVSEAFTLSDEINNLSNGELVEYFKDYSEADFSTLEINAIDKTIEARWCTSAVTVAICCHTVAPCVRGMQRLLKRKYCEGSGYHYYWIWGSCC